MADAARRCHRPIMRNLIPCLSILLMIVLSQATFAAENEADYREAARLLDDQGGAERPFLDSPRDRALDRATVEFLHDNQPAMRLLLLAATKRPADAMTPDANEMEAWIGELSGMRRLGRLGILHIEATLQSRLDMQNGRPDRAVDDLVATLALARHTGRGQWMAARLIELGIEQEATECLADILPALPAESLPRLRRKLSALPPPTSSKATLLAEFAYMISQPDADASLKRLEPFYIALAEASDSSPDEFAAAVDREIARLDNNIFAKIIGPTLKAFRIPQATLEAKRAMLPVAIDVLERGRDAVQASRDPFGDGPFGYEATDNGFILKSELIVRNEQVVLRVGTPR